MTVPAFLTERAELARLDAHFVRVLRDLHAHPPPRLGRAARRARAAHLERLDAYRRRAEFPKNRRFPGRMLPHFIDEGGIRCAMAHLMDATGAATRDFVQHVARSANYARIRDLAGVPELVAWLDANGLTVEEAARIQPTYCGTPANACVCATAIYNGMLKGTPSTLADGGTGLSVSAIFGPVKNVSVNDVVPLLGAGGLGPTDTVYALWIPSTGPATVRFVASAGSTTVPIPLSACSASEISSVPGPLPVPTLDQAMSAATLAACEQVLAQYDAKWGQIQGGPECFGSGGTGGSAGGTGAGGNGTGGTGGATAGAGGSSAGTGGSSSSSGGSGGAREDSSDGCSCSVLGHTEAGAEAAIAITAAAILLHGARRRARWSARASRAA